MAKQEKSAAELYREERKKRIAKAAKNNSKKHISDKTQKRIVSFIAIVLVVAIAGSITGGIVSNRGVFERNKVIMTVGDSEIDKYEYSFYYTTLLQSYVVQAVQYQMYGMSMGVDFTKSLAEQSYSGELEGYENPTFADYFEKNTIEAIKSIKASVAYAKENNITLTEEDNKTIEETFANIDQSRTNTDGSKYSVGAYLRLSYGKGMTEKLYRRILEEQLLAQRVSLVKQDEYKAAYTDEDVEKAFNDDIDTYGYVTLRSYAVSVKTDDETEKASEEEIAQAKETAEAFAQEITDEASFKTLAAEYAKQAGTETADEFLTDESLTLQENVTLSTFSSDEDLHAWVKSAKAGETYVKSTDENSTVYYMVDPLHKAADSYTYDVRHILVKFPDADDEEVTDGNAKEELEAKTFDASAYDATIVNNIKQPITDVECYNKAVDIFTSYLEGDKTEDAFAALAVANSDDSNASEGGIYENVAQGKMVSEFEDWALAKDRKTGDVGIVETEYGYHIMYQIGKNVTTWADTIKSDLAQEEFNSFYDELIAGDNVVAGELDEEMNAEIKANMDSTAKNLYNSYMSQYSSAYGY